MRVLVMIAYYTPEIAGGLYLETNLFDDMAGYGLDVDIFAPLPSRGVDRKIRKEYMKKKLEIKSDGKQRIHRFYLPRERDNTILRAIRYLFMNFAFLCKGILAPADLIFVESTPPTQGAMGALLKKLKKVPMIYVLQDIFPDSLVNSGLIKRDSLIWKIGRKIEDFTYENADRIITISEDFKNNIASKGVPTEKIEVIYNWADENAVKNIDRKKNRLFSKYGLDSNKFYITHCGNIGYTQNMDMLLEAAKELENYRDLEFILIGDGAYKAEVERSISDKGIKNLEIIPFQPYEDISLVFSLGDVGLIISKPNVGENSVPCKTWSIMSAERPILASFDLGGVLNTIINKSDSGVCVQAGDKEKLKEAILYFYNNREEAFQKGLNGRRYVMNNLTRNSGTSKYIEIIKQYDQSSV